MQMNVSGLAAVAAHPPRHNSDQQQCKIGPCRLQDISPLMPWDQQQCTLSCTEMHHMILTDQYCYQCASLYCSITYSTLQHPLQAHGDHHQAQWLPGDTLTRGLCSQELPGQ